VTLIPVGAATLSATTDRAVIGWFSGDLINGRLVLRVTTTYPSNMSGLAFAVVSLIESDTNARVLGDARYYPKPEPTAIALGYGDRSTATGEVVIEPRAYNLRWLMRENSPRYWRVLVEAETPSGVSVPTYAPGGYATPEVTLSATGVTGTDGNTYGQLNWYV
jgi:hypothetical protein